MSTAKAGLNRFIMFLFALIFGAICAWGVGQLLNQSWAETTTQTVQDTNLAQIPQRADYPNWIIGVAAVLILLGIILVVMNLGRRTLTTATLDRSDAESTVPEGESPVLGRITVNPDDVASAIAQDAEHIKGVRKAKARARQDRDQNVIDIHISAAPDADMQAIHRYAATQQDAALRGVPGLNLRTRTFLSIDKV